MTLERVLVLQMCRMGDILQTGPMLRGLRREYPDAAITLVVLDRFAGTPLPAHLYDRLVPFPHHSLAAGLTGQKADWQAQLERLDEFVRDLGDVPFDLAINLTHTDLSSLLMSIVPARDRRGPVIKPDRQRAVLGDWMQYFWAHARARALGCFNLVDLYSWAAGVACDDGGLEMAVAPDAEGRVTDWLSARALGGRPLIAIQLGASSEAKRYPAESFAAAVDRLPADDGEIVLVGAEAERPLAERFLATVKRNVHDSLGAMPIPELGALLRRCRLLITNDTGPMHVATAMGTRVVDISTGPVFVHETGPYGPGHVIVEPGIDCFPCAAGATCHHLACRERVPPCDIAAIARFALDQAPAPRGVRLLRPRRARSGRIEFWPVASEQVNEHDVLRLHSARVWEDTLGAPVPNARGGRRKSGGPGGKGEAEGLEVRTVLAPERLGAIAGALQEVAVVAGRAATLVRRLPTASAGLQARMAAEAHTHLQRLVRLGETERACYPVVGFLVQQIESVQACDLPSVAREQARAYAAAADRAARLASVLAP